MTKTITILGAGKSSYNLVSYLSKNQERIGIDIKVISNQTPKYINDFQKIDFQKIDIYDNSQISKQIKSSFIVVSLLPPKLHYQIALICSSYKINMITASYLDNKIKSFKFGITHPKGIVKKLTIVIAAEKFKAISQTGSVVDNCLIAIAT